MVRLVPARLLFVLALAMCCAVYPVRAQLFETRAQQAYLIDADTGTVLFAKNEK